MSGVEEDDLRARRSTRYEVDEHDVARHRRQHNEIGAERVLGPRHHVFGRRISEAGIDGRDVERGQVERGHLDRADALGAAGGGAVGCNDG